MFDVIIRELEEKDIKEVTELVTKFFEIKDLENGYHKILSFYKDYKVLLAISDGKIVGHSLVFSKYDLKEDKKSFWLEYVCVDEKYQGYGIATKMLKKLEQIAKDEDVSFIRFKSDNSRKSAHACYLKNQYKKVDTTVFEKYF